jgi:hypothetical protein
MLAERLARLISVDLRYSSADYVVGLLPYVEPIRSNRYVATPHSPGRAATAVRACHPPCHWYYDSHRHDIYSALPGPQNTPPSRSISFHRTPRASPPRSRSQDGELKAERPDPGSRANRRRIRASPATSTRRGGYSSERIENWYAQWCEMSDVARQDRQSVVLCRRRDDDVGYSRRLALSARPV